MSTEPIESAYCVLQALPAGPSLRVLSFAGLFSGHLAPPAPISSLSPPILPPVLVSGPPFSPGPPSREDSVHILSDPCAAASPHLHALLRVPLASPLLSALQAMSWGGGRQALSTCCVLFPKSSPFFLPLCLPSHHHHHPPIPHPRTPAFSRLSARRRMGI